MFNKESGRRGSKSERSNGVLLTVVGKMKQSPCDYISKQRGSTRNLEVWLVECSGLERKAQGEINWLLEVGEITR